MYAHHNKTGEKFLRSYIKIFGPPISDALIELEKIAINMPEVCMMDYAIQRDISPCIASDLGANKVETYEESIPNFFVKRTGVVVPIERCHKLISKYGEKLGEYDFFFEWKEKPENSQLNTLIKRIDEAFKQLGCLYTITTK